MAVPAAEAEIEAAPRPPPAARHRRRVGDVRGGAPNPSLPLNPDRSRCTCRNLSGRRSRSGARERRSRPDALAPAAKATAAMVAGYAPVARAIVRPPEPDGIEDELAYRIGIPGAKRPERPAVIEVAGGQEVVVPVLPTVETEVWPERRGRKRRLAAIGMTALVSASALAVAVAVLVPSLSQPDSGVLTATGTPRATTDAGSCLQGPRARARRHTSRAARVSRARGLALARPDAAAATLRVARPDAVADTLRVGGCDRPGEDRLGHPSSPDDAARRGTCADRQVRLSKRRLAVDLRRVQVERRHEVRVGLWRGPDGARRHGVPHVRGGWQLPRHARCERPDRLRDAGGSVHRSRSPVGDGRVVVDGFVVLRSTATGRSRSAILPPPCQVAHDRARPGLGLRRPLLGDRHLTPGHDTGRRAGRLLGRRATRDPPGLHDWSASSPAPGPGP